MHFASSSFYANVVRPKIAVQFTIVVRWYCSKLHDKSFDTHNDVCLTCILADSPYLSQGLDGLLLLFPIIVVQLWVLLSWDCVAEVCG